MSAFRAHGTGASAKFNADESRLLVSLATQIAELVAERGPVHEDPALLRLLPDAYRDSPDNAAEFRRFTEEELSDEKAHNALIVAEMVQLQPKSRSVRVELDAAQSLIWLKSLNDIRLALSVRLGIDNDGLPTSVDAEASFTFAVYHWLGALQETLVKAIDR